MENVINNFVNKKTIKYFTIESKMLNFCEKLFNMVITFIFISAYWTQINCYNVSTNINLSHKKCNYYKKNNFYFKSYIYIECDYLKNKKHFFKSNDFTKQK